MILQRFSLTLAGFLIVVAAGLQPAPDRLQIGPTAPANLCENRSSVYADEVIEHVVYSHPCKHPFSSVR